MDTTQDTLEEHDTLVTLDGVVTNMVTMATDGEQKDNNTTGNIEEQLNNLESSQNGDELNDELDTFLIRYLYFLYIHFSCMRMRVRSYQWKVPM